MYRHYTIMIGPLSPFFNFIFKKLTNFWLQWVFVAAQRLSLVAASGGYSLVAL